MLSILQNILVLSSLTTAKTFARNLLDEPGFNESRILFDFTEFTVGSSSRVKINFRNFQLSPYFYISSGKNPVFSSTYMSITSRSFIFSSSNYPIKSGPVLQGNKSSPGNSHKNVLPGEIVMEKKGSILQINSTIPSNNDSMVTGDMCLCKGVSDDVFKFFNELTSLDDQDTPVLGIEIDEKLIDCCGTQSFQVLGKFSLVVLCVVITPETTMLTPSLFTSRLENVVLKLQKFVRRVNKNCVIVLRIKFKSKHVLQEKKRHLYLAYFKTFLENWSNSIDENLKIVLETYSIQTKLKVKNLRDDVIPFVSDLYTRHYRDNLSSVCQTHELHNTISSSFNNIFLYNLTPKRFKALMECCCENYFIPKRPRNFNFYLHFQRNDLDILRMLDEHMLSLPITTIFITPTRTMNQPHLLSVLVNKTELLGVEIGCYLKEMQNPFDKPFQDFTADVIHSCGQVFNASSVILLEYTLYSQYVDDLPRIMLKIDKTISQFNRNYKNKTLMILIVLVTNENKFYPINLLHDTSPLTIYCDADLMKQVEISDAIINFANVLNIGKIAIQSYANKAFLSGWWNSIETMPQINRSVTDFPVLVQRNVPQWLRKDMTLISSYQCINRTKSADNFGIKFSKNFSGVTLNTSGLNALQSSLTREEIRIPLLFIFGKFSMIECAINSNLRIDTLKSAINQRFLNAIIASGETSLYLEVASKSITSTLLNQIQSLSLQLSKLDNFTFGVHFSQWENQHELISQNIQKINKNEMNESVFLIGLTVDCLKDVNNQFQGLKVFSLFSPINYIVCNMHPVNATNYDQATMQTFMDTIIYLKSYILRLHEFQHLQVFFRINYIPFKCDAGRSTVDEFLRFLYDMNQYTWVYKIKYFLVPAFEKKILSNKLCPVSWWKISKDSDLTNLSAYTETESEYFGRKTTPGLDFSELPDGFVKLGDETNSLVIGMTMLFLGTLVAVIALVFKLNNIRKRYLTNEEVEAFRNGKVPVDGEVLALEEMKFLDKFEIEKHNLELCKVIGRGNFGLVYRGILNDEMSVAVKMPHSECSKESFKSMLAEVKIMSYIGAHPYVLSLVATYTKEIQKGQIFIITELCEKGSLQNHLRSNPSVDCIGLYELQRFAYQIASGMDFISGHNIIHGDLSTRNVLLNEDGVCKIGDFGLSRRLYDYQKYIKKSKEPLPYRWMALESLQRMEFTTKSDVWSYGVTLWEIFSHGKIPYIGLALCPEFVADLEKGMRLPKIENFSDDVYDKMNNCWDMLPEN